MKNNDYQKKYDLLKKQIENIGFICTGSVLSVYNTCGNSNCRCHKDKNARHGPYNIWTRKIEAKTVTRVLSDEQAQLCRECIQNIRKLENIIEEMKKISVQYIENYNSEIITERNKGKL